MITGDDLKIAEAIAKNARIINLSEKYRSMTGKDFIDNIGGIICKTSTMETDKCNSKNNRSNKNEIWRI